jgi:hypothetical protein
MTAMSLWRSEAARRGWARRREAERARLFAQWDFAVLGLFTRALKSKGITPGERAQLQQIKTQLRRQIVAQPETPKK